MTNKDPVMQIISINTSVLKEVAYQDKTILTGIFKKPINGPVLVEKLNLVSDKQADLENHGGEHKAVYAFSEHHYPYWREALNSQELSSGAFGENLTISHLDEAKIQLGDQYQVGNCILEVSQPRVPCFKLGLALDNKQAPKLFTQHFRTGVYFRVLEEGSIQIGDELTLIKRVPNSVSIHDLFKAKFDKGFDGADDVITRAYKLDCISPEWREKIVKLYSKMLVN